MNLPAMFYKYKSVHKRANTSAYLSVPNIEVVYGPMRRHPLLSFLLLTFGLSWGYELIVIVLLGLPTNPWVFPVAFIGPSLAAFIMTAVTEDRAGVIRLLRSYLRWRVGWCWYFLVLVAVPLLQIGVDLMVTRSFNVVGAMTSTFVLSYGTGLLVGGPLGEEAGWRAFALPRLQKRMGPLKGSVVLGVCWACWHLPTFLIPGMGEDASTLRSGVVLFGLFVVSTVALSLLFTWVYNSTRGSLLVTILLHTAINFPALTNTVLHGVVQVVMWGGLALMLVIATRGRLGYESYSNETTPLTWEAMSKVDAERMAA
jgi:uncharacterized protein